VAPVRYPVLNIKIKSIVQKIAVNHSMAMRAELSSPTSNACIGIVHRSQVIQRRQKVFQTVRGIPSGSMTPQRQPHPQQLLSLFFATGTSSAIAVTEECALLMFIEDCLCSVCALKKKLSLQA
jgi:hypothetical protein